MEAAPAAAGPGRAVTFAEITTSYKKLLRPWMKKVMPAYLLLAAGMLVLSVPGWIVSYLQLQAIAMMDFQTIATLGMIGGLARFVSGLGILAIVTVRVGLSRPIRAILVEGPDAVEGPRAALHTATRGFWPLLGITIVCGVAIGVGLVLCVLPGLAAMFLLLAAPYLVAVGASDFASSFKRSFDLVTKNVGPLLGVIGILVGAFVVIAGITIAIRAIVVMSLGLAAAAFAEPVALLLGEAAGIFWWPLVGAALVTVETAYTGVPLK